MKYILAPVTVVSVQIPSQILKLSKIIYDFAKSTWQASIILTENEVAKSMNFDDLRYEFTETGTRKILWSVEISH